MTLAVRETNTLALAAQAMQLFDFGGMLVKSGMLPSSVRTPESAVAIMVKGMELGLPPMAALNGITVIQGKPTVSPQLMLSLINRSGQLEDIQIQTGPQGATVTMKRRGRTAFSASFGPTEAKDMGLSTKDNYKKQAPVMYQWRAVAACARVVFPDVIDGLYTPEEMGADVQVDEDGAMTVTAMQEAKPDRRVDITREVAEQAGVPVKTLPDPQQEAALQAWATKIGDLATRVRKVAPPEGVQMILDNHEWRTDIMEARRCYESLKALGLEHTPQQPAQQPQEAAPTQEAEVLLNEGQRKALCQYATRAGAKTSQDRALLWGLALNLSAPVGTKTLTEEQAAVILGIYAGYDDKEIGQVLEEARNVLAEGMGF